MQQQHKSHLTYCVMLTAMGLLTWCFLSVHVNHPNTKSVVLSVFFFKFIRAFGPTLVTIRETFTECPGPNSGIVIVG
ncbi:hypothetical protein PHAVU_003G211000 [Phaseolus vulgaris]|uniref:Uncharacterized protein n=1 Tax=Phaseolus vulgaris TaxID=3885 RepID=V7CBG3_PHAVU|nr:hypothetical protein PHAVU_003G211000g [Phaseolus vulgaris]ESW27542.1 hypothetical protein PHAVU_003G211000g [Phaseolus vulgaris]